VIYSYIVCSLVLCVLLVFAAKEIGRVIKGELIIAIFFALLAIFGLFHFRLFREAQAGSVMIDPCLLLDVSSLFFMLFVWTVPLLVLRKSIMRYSHITGVILK
jgi:hypothetical protein